MLKVTLTPPDRLKAPLASFDFNLTEFKFEYVTNLFFFFVIYLPDVSERVTHPPMSNFSIDEK